MNKNILFIIKIFFLSVILMVGRIVEAGQFITIHNIDAESSHPYVTLEVSVRNPNGKKDFSLDEENISVYEDNYKVNYVNVKKMDDVEDYIYFVFSLDSSRSITDNFLKKIKASAKDIIKNSGPQDKIAVFNFDDSVKSLNFFSTNKIELEKNIDSIKREGTKTLLYNAIHDSIEVLKNIEHNRRIIVVFTDGKDEGSSVTESDIINKAQAVGIPIYFLCLGEPQHIKKMARIAKLSGGKLLLSSQKEDVTHMYKIIMSLIKNRYFIQYKSLLQNEKTKHKVEVRIKINTLSDNDIAYFERSKNFVAMLIGALYKNSTLLLAILFIIAILIIFSLFFNKERIVIKKESNELPKIHVSYDRDSSTPMTPVITPEDAEYSYATAWLIEKDGPASGRRYPIYWNEVTIGRSRENSIVINDESVSATHAKIKNKNNTYYILDLISDNGVYLNGKKLLRPRSLHDWDEIRLGRTAFIFRGLKVKT